MTETLRSPRNVPIIGYTPTITHTLTQSITGYPAAYSSLVTPVFSLNTKLIRIVSDHDIFTIDIGPNPVVGINEPNLFSNMVCRPQIPEYFTVEPGDRASILSLQFAFADPTSTVWITELI